MKTLIWSTGIYLVCIFSLSGAWADGEINFLRPPQVLKNDQTLISQNRRFELGFFNVCSVNSSDQDLRYLGVWYRGIQPLTVVWIANRMNPLHGINIKLVLNLIGDLSLHEENRTKWISRLYQPVSRPTLFLLDSGNVVIKDGKKNKNLWESFSFPSDTLLPGMKLGWDVQPGRGIVVNRVLTSWKNSNDPSNGKFVFRVESLQSPQLLLLNDMVTQSRWGPWNGQEFSGAYFEKGKHGFSLAYSSIHEGAGLKFKASDESMLLRLVVNHMGLVKFMAWRNDTKQWASITTLNKDGCDVYGSCGFFGVCYTKEPHCRCLEGFMTDSPNDWQNGKGCRRISSLNCGRGDGFVEQYGLKLPDKFTVLRHVSPQHCGDYCFKECSCTAYTNINIYGNGSTCVVWFDKLLDIRSLKHGGNSVYLRVVRQESGDSDVISDRKFVVILVIVLSALLLTAAWCIKGLVFGSETAKNQVCKEKAEADTRWVQDNSHVPLFDRRMICAATKNFSICHKIGEGGFGPVYQGEFPDGRKIAVKRLSESSCQGAEEFQNEVSLTARLQHPNLANLIGCCVEGGEKMLVYEYMSNKSLDQFIFNQCRKNLLPWKARFNVLLGVAKGLEYLHFGSGLRLIHRDLKASNILLDAEMNPKISDFGLARSVQTESEEITSKVIGTRGYMSPEYMLGGCYSTRSDVFSFGVLALEVVSGHRNWRFCHPDHDFNLLGHAWTLWVAGKEMEVMDVILAGSYVENEVKKCIQIGLLCVQNSSQNRPTMTQVVSMLVNTEDARVAELQEPGFYRLKPGSRLSPTSVVGIMPETVNCLTITALTGRTLCYNT